MDISKYIDAIHWDDLNVASGKASRVPEALLGLISAADETRNQSYWRLDNEIVLQSDLYEAAYFVVPILIQMLREKPAHGREEIYDLLYELANGYAPETIVCHRSDGHIVPLKQGCREEIKKGMSIFKSDMLLQSSRLSVKAKELVELLVEDGVS